jgi:hypothetical protein
MVGNYESYPNGKPSLLSQTLRSILMFSLRFQAEHLSFPLQSQSTGRVSNLELTAKFKASLYFPFQSDRRSTYNKTVSLYSANY